MTGRTVGRCAVAALCTSTRPEFRSLDKVSCEAGWLFPRVEPRTGEWKDVPCSLAVRDSRDRALPEALGS
jgi:hypothetical protein